MALASFDHDVVDQAGPADPRGDRHQYGPPIESRCRSEELGVAGLQVLGLDLRPLELRPRRLERDLDPLLARLRDFPRGLEAPRQGSRPGTLLGAQIRVPRAHREPVWL